MKNRINRLLKIGILCFVMVLIQTSCEKNDYSIENELQQENKISRVSFSDFNINVTHNRQYQDLERYLDIKKSSNQNLQNRIDADDDITILTDEILVINKNDISYYTFKIVTPSENNEFYNLVVHVNNQQQIIKSELYEYIPNNNWLQDINQPYTGLIKVLDNDIISLDDLFSARGSGRCLIGASGEWNCGANNNHEPGNTNCDPANNAVTEYIITLEYGPCPNEPQPYIFAEAPTPAGGNGGGGGGIPNQNPTPTIPTTPCKSDNGQQTLGITDGNGDCYDEDTLFDEQVFIDDDFKDNTCLKSVYDEMGKASTFKGYLENFEPEFSVAHLRFSSSTTLPDNTNAETSAPENYLITITFNENNLDRPRLSIARTMIHEMIHAEIFRKLLSVAQHPSIQLDQNQIVQLRNDYPGLYDYYMRWKWNVPQGQSPSSAQHEAMAQHYRDIIKQALEEFDSSQTDEVYEALAWTGLQNTVAWNSLSQTERDNINQTLTDFFANNPNCQ